jgi:hypothetical protein
MASEAEPVAARRRPVASSFLRPRSELPEVLVPSSQADVMRQGAPCWLRASQQKYALARCFFPVHPLSVKDFTAHIHVGLFTRLCPIPSPCSLQLPADHPSLLVLARVVGRMMAAAGGAPVYTAAVGLDREMRQSIALASQQVA